MTGTEFSDVAADKRGLAGGGISGACPEVES
jgi:hypothetical protein